MSPPRVSAHLASGSLPGPYRAPWWLSHAHSQTVWTALFSRTDAVCYRRQRWDTPDGDFIDVDFVDPPKKSGQCEDSEDSATRHAGAQMPLVVLFHGLEGSSASIYARAMAAATRVPNSAWVLSPVPTAVPPAASS